MNQHSYALAVREAKQQQVSHFNATGLYLFFFKAQLAWAIYTTCGDFFTF